MNISSFSTPVSVFILFLINADLSYAFTKPAPTLTPDLVFQNPLIQKVDNLKVVDDSLFQEIDELKAVDDSLFQEIDKLKEAEDPLFQEVEKLKEETAYSDESNLLPDETLDIVHNCRRTNYNLQNQEVICNNIRDLDNQVRRRMRVQFDDAVRSCNTFIERTVQTTCKTVKALTKPTQEQTGNNAAKLYCEAANQLKTAVNRTNKALQSCVSAKNTCENSGSICDINITRSDAFFEPLTQDLRESCGSINEPLQSVEIALNNVKSTASSVQKNCLALKPKSKTSENPDNGSWKSRAPASLTKEKSNFNPVGLAKAALPFLSSGNRKQQADTSKQPAPNYTGSSYNENNTPTSKTNHLNSEVRVSGRDTHLLPSMKKNADTINARFSRTLKSSEETENISDTKKDTNTINATFNKGPIPEGTTVANLADSNNITATNLTDAENNDTDSSGDEFSSNQEEDTDSSGGGGSISGHKIISASGGGGRLSIRPSAYKKHGKKAVTAKLKSARKKFGKKMPLIFKNGEFVLDFLAMKESQVFKKKQAAMEGYWKGEKSKSPTPTNDVNPNRKLNIFKLMNFRYQKTLYTKDR